MKKLFALIVVLSVLLLSACGTEPEIDLGDSAVFSEGDRMAAVDVILDQFNSWEGCKMYSVSYAGDEVSSENLDYVRSLDEEKDFTECIVFDTSFRSPIRGGGAWNANTVYDWTWYLAREADGEWHLLTWGVG